MPDRNLFPTQTDVGLKYAVTTDEGMRFYAPVSNMVNRVVPNRINPFVTDGTTQKFPLGSELQYGDRKFRYALAGGSALAVGKLMQSVVPLAGHIKQVIAAAAIGDTTITFTPLTASTNDLVKNELADGYIHINAGTGLGYMYRIKSHPAITGATAGVLTLYDPIVIATPAASTATVLHNPWRGIIISPTGTTTTLSPPVGVTVCAWAANEYGWLQYQGPCPVLADGTLLIGKGVMKSTNTTGAVMAWGLTEATPNTEITPAVGWVMAVNVTTEYAPIWLMIP